MRRIISFIILVSLAAVLAASPVGAAAETQTSGDWEYSVSYEGEARIMRYTGGETDVVIPAVLGEYPVTALWYWRTEDEYFRGIFFDTPVENVTIPESVTLIAGDAFWGCSSIKSVTIPGSVKTIMEYAFFECTSLTGITIPEGVTSIGMNAFNSCTALESVSLPEGLSDIPFGAFDGCAALKSIVIPDGVSVIGKYAFDGCSSLESVTVPDTVSKIDDNAFDNCSALKTVYYAGTENEWNDVEIGDKNRKLTKAEVIFNYDPAAGPAEDSPSGAKDYGNDYQPVLPTFVIIIAVAAGTLVVAGIVAAAVIVIAVKKKRNK